MALVPVHEIDLAASRIAATCLRTPVLPFAVDADRGAGSPLLLKAESLQPTGAFKLRGATNAIAQLTPAQRERGVVTHSSGNHGQAIAFAAAAAGISATVVMPQGAPVVKVDAVRRYGGEVVFVAPAQRSSRCAEIAERTGATIIEPYDDLRVIAGQGTVGLEILEQVPDVAVVLVPVSGGGLISGIATAIKSRKPGTKIVGVEPELAGDLAEGFSVGSRRVWSTELTGRTIADGLRTGSVGLQNWEHIRAYVDAVVTVSEKAIISAMREIAERCRLIVEPSGAVATAAFLEKSDRIPRGVTVAIASGGNVDMDLFTSAWA